jgi:hypothetical protein
MSSRYGYIRVSSRDQNEDRQLIAMLELQISSSNIYTDKQCHLKIPVRCRYLLRVLFLHYILAHNAPISS